MVVNWDVINAAGTWAAGTGTIGAVILALRHNKPKVKVEAQVMSCTQPLPIGDRMVKDNILYISATNIGEVPVNIL